jgi:cytochrome P450
MANYPEMQNKMRDEIDSVIGERMPLQEDRNHCHYVNAFISEGMRYRPIVPFAFPHKTMVQSKIGIHISKTFSKFSFQKYFHFF